MGVNLALFRNPPTLFREKSHALTLCRRSRPRADAWQTTRSSGPWLEIHSAADFLTQTPENTRMSKTNKTWARHTHSDRQTPSFIDRSIEAGILLGHTHSYHDP